MLIIDPKNSLKASGWSPIEVPLAELKTCGLRLASRMSA
jgi:hypothetical protein